VGAEDRLRVSRPSTDLLDVFGRRRSGPAASSARAVSRPRAASHASFEVTRRQALLCGCAALLLLVLAFVGGLAVGRARGPGVASPELARTATPARETWILRGRSLPRLGVGADNLEKRALEQISANHPELVPFLAAVPVEEGQGRVNKFHFRLIVRGFDSEAKANDWARTLARERVGEHYPFHDSRPERMSR
jgi:hypothetical protein